jgi:hypothetical protein
MFATVRRYPDLTPSAIEGWASRMADIGAVLESVPGWVSCLLIRTRDGVILVSVGDDEASLIESGRRLAARLAGPADGLRPAAPDIWAGDVLIAAPPARHASPQPARAPASHTDQKT